MTQPTPYPTDALEALRRMYEAGTLPEPMYRAALAAANASNSTVNTGSGAVAQGTYAKAVGAGGVMITGDALGDVMVNAIKIVVGAGRDPTEEREWLAHYLNGVIRDCVNLKLDAIDPGAASTNRRALQLTDVYVDLNTTLTCPESMSLHQYWAQKDAAESPDLLASLGKYFRRAISRKAESAEREQKSRPVSVLEALAEHRDMVLLGVPGSGKSTIVAFVTLNLAQACGGVAAALEALGPGWTHGAMLPIRVTLRQFAQTLAGKLKRQEAINPRDLWDFIRVELGRTLPQPSVDFIEKLAWRNGALFLFDGLDEASSLEVREAMLRVIYEFKQTAPLSSRFLITARPYAWAGAPSPERGEYELDSLNNEQIEAFVKRWYEAIERLGWKQPDEALRKRDEMLQQIPRPDLNALLSNPLLLTMAATLQTNGSRLPDDRADLYDGIVELLLRRWNERTGLDQALLEQLNMPGLTLTHIRVKVEEIAFETHAASVQLEGSADVSEHLLRKAFKPMLNNSGDKADQVVDYLDKRAGLLIGLGERDHALQFAFPHRSFQEFLAACHLAGRTNLNESALALAKQSPGHWREVLLLAARLAKPDRGCALADALIGGRSYEDTLTRHSREQLDENDCQRAILAAWQLNELGLPAVQASDSRIAVRERVTSWLLATMDMRCLHQTPSIRARAGTVLAQIGDPRFDHTLYGLPIDIDNGFIRIPKGIFRMGTPQNDILKLIKKFGGEVDHFQRETPQHPVTMNEYWISRYPVTVLQYRLFAEATGRKFDRERNCIDNHPVVQVNWYDALAYCSWLTARLQADIKVVAPWKEVLARGGKVSLPSEAEWEYASRGLLGDREFPWGNEIDPNKMNIVETGLAGTTTVGCFVNGASHFGCEELSGNVWEWTRSLWGTDGNLEFMYPYTNNRSVRESVDADGKVWRVVRGGAFSDAARFARCAYRFRYIPDDLFLNYLGFRIVILP